MQGSVQALCCTIGGWVPWDCEVEGDSFSFAPILNLLQMYSDPLSQKMVPILFWVMTSYRSSSVIVALATASVKCNNGVFGVIIENALEVEAAIQARNFYLSTHVNVNDSHGSGSSGVRCGIGFFVHLRENADLTGLFTHFLECR